MRTRTFVTAIVVVLIVAGVLTACGEHATQPLEAGFGPSPVLPPPNHTLLPTVNVASATHWPPGATPTAAPGLRVVALAQGLDHPRWLAVLPNNDILVAETNAPKRPDDGTGVRGLVQRLIVSNAGAAVASANRITLLRDDGHGQMERHVFLKDLNSPFGMVLIGNDLYVADTDALLKFHYEPGQTEITTPGIKVSDLPGGPINHHWTKNVVASPDGRTLYVSVGSNSNVAENGLAAEADVPLCGRSMRQRGRTASLPAVCVIRSAWPGSRKPARSGRGERARRDRQRPGAGLHDGGA